MLLCCFSVRRPEAPGWLACSSPRWHPRTRSRSGDRNRPVGEPAPVRDGARKPAPGPATGTARLVSLLQSEAASANPLSVRRPEPPGWRACSSPRWRPQTRSRSGDRNRPVGEPAPVRGGVREPALGPATGTARLVSLSNHKGRPWMSHHPNIQHCKRILNKTLSILRSRSDLFV